ncbi:MAG: hypothetical protein ACI85Q_002932 [Salibacteraceae bacterium]|jgi:hypothetical protein
MHSHNVRFLPATYSKKTMLNQVGVFEGLTTSKELEALIIEQVEKGFELHSVVAVTTSNMGVVFTSGFMVTFKKVE